MEEAHGALREKQWQARMEDSEEPPLYQVRDWVWMVSYRRRHRQPAKLQPKLVEPFCVIEALPNYMYRVERSGQVLVHNEQWLKPCHGRSDPARQAAPLL